MNHGVTLQPTGSISSCGAVSFRTSLEQYEIENVPFRYAAPVLKGRELGDVCTYHHVRELVASIASRRDERAQNATTGTLSYTREATLADDSDNVSDAVASIEVFGMDARDFGKSARVGTWASSRRASTLPAHVPGGARPRRQERTDSRSHGET